VCGMKRSRACSSSSSSSTHLVSSRA
jgi:hypothetical protein